MIIVLSQIFFWKTQPQSRYVIYNKTSYKDDKTIIRMGSGVGWGVTQNIWCCYR